jgi:glutathionyl-hydroquinone reductase
MGVLIQGKWTDGGLPQETGQTGQFKRADSIFHGRVSADGSSGFKAEPGRYHDLPKGTPVDFGRFGPSR